MSEPREPVTEAGRRWVAGWHTHVDGGEVSPINEYAVAQLTEAIVAVETESAVAAWAEALAEIRAGVERLAVLWAGGRAKDSPYVLRSAVLALLEPK